jgi:hypothetical protein
MGLARDRILQEVRTCPKSQDFRAALKDPAENAGSLLYYYFQYTKWSKTRMQVISLEEAL